MLVLSRKVGERIQIGDDIVVVVNKVAGNRVTIGIEAPGNVRIVRGELEQFQDAPQSPAAKQTVSAPLLPIDSFAGADSMDWIPRNAR